MIVFVGEYFVLTNYQLIPAGIYWLLLIFLRVFFIAFFGLFNSFVGPGQIGFWLLNCFFLYRVCPLQIQFFFLFSEFAYGQKLNN